MVEPDQSERPRCRSCGSTEILRDAYAIWDVDRQEWVLNSCYDLYRCENCEEESKRVDWLI